MYAFLVPIFLPFLVSNLWSGIAAMMEIESIDSSAELRPSNSVISQLGHTETERLAIQFSADFHEFSALLDRWENNIAHFAESLLSVGTNGRNHGASSPVTEAIKIDPRTGRPVDKLGINMPKRVVEKWMEKQKAEAMHEEQRSLNWAVLEKEAAELGDQVWADLMQENSRTILGNGQLNLTIQKEKAPMNEEEKLLFEAKYQEEFESRSASKLIFEEYRERCMKKLIAKYKTEDLKPKMKVRRLLDTLIQKQALLLPMANGTLLPAKFTVEEKEKYMKLFVEEELRENGVELVTTLYLEDRRQYDGFVKIVREKRAGNDQLTPQEGGELTRRFWERNILKEIFSNWKCAETRAKFMGLASQRGRPKKAVAKEAEEIRSTCMTMQSMAQQLFAYIDIVLYFGGKMPTTGIISEEVASTSRTPPRQMDVRVAAIPMKELVRHPIRPIIRFGYVDEDRRTLRAKEEFRSVSEFVQMLAGAYALLRQAVLPIRYNEMEMANTILFDSLALWEESYNWMEHLPQTNEEVQQMETAAAAAAADRPGIGKAIRRFKSRARTVASRFTTSMMRKAGRRRQQQNQANTHHQQHFVLLYEGSKYILSKEQLTERDLILPQLLGRSVSADFERRWKQLLFHPAMLMGVAQWGMVPPPGQWSPPVLRVNIDDYRQNVEQLREQFNSADWAPQKKWELFVRENQPKFEAELETARRRLHGSNYNRAKHGGFMGELEVLDEPEFPVDQKYDYDVGVDMWQNVERDIWNAKRKVEWVKRRGKEVEWMRQQMQMVLLHGQYVPEVLAEYAHRVDGFLRSYLHARMPNSVPMSPLSASSTLAAHRGSNYSDSDREINEEYEEEMALKNWAAMQDMIKEKEEPIKNDVSVIIPSAADASNKERTDSAASNDYSAIDSLESRVQRQPSNYRHGHSPRRQQQQQLDSAQSTSSFTDSNDFRSCCSSLKDAGDQEDEPGQI